MPRIIPTAIAAFALTMLGLRAWQLQSEQATAAVGTNSTALNVTNQVLRDLGATTAYGLPMGMLVLGVAFVLALGYGVMN